MDNTTFLLKNYEKMIELGLTTKEVVKEKLGEELKSSFDKIHNNYLNQKEVQLKQYHKRYNSDTDVSKENKKKRAEAYRLRYQTNPEYREKQKNRMKEYRARKKGLIIIS